VHKVHLLFIGNNSACRNCGLEIKVDIQTFSLQPGCQPILGPNIHSGGPDSEHCLCDRMAHSTCSCSPRLPSWHPGCGTMGWAPTWHPLGKH